MNFRTASLLSLALIWPAAAVLPAAAQGSEPLSAIDWLSDSVGEVPAAMPPPPSAGPAFPGGDIAQTAMPGAISVVPLNQASSDAVGLLTSEETGLPQDLWGASGASDLAGALGGEPLDMGPAMRDLMRRVLLAELDPPYDAASDQSLFLARIDRLLRIGYLDEAGALLTRAGTRDPERFRRWFDVSLLTGTENAACDQLRAAPEIAPTYPARIFCLARGGDWPAAALTLETARALDILTPEEEVLLGLFLDDGFVEEPLVPPAPRRPSPLTFRIYEAIGEPLPTATLPVAFAHADLIETNGWKTRLEAGERLARTGALSPEALIALYLERRPAASGGVWDRAAAIQSLDRALSDVRSDDAADALASAWPLMRDAGLAAPFAQVFGPRLSYAGFDGDSAARAFRIGLLSPDYAQIAAGYRPQSQEDRFLVALARGVPQFATTASRQGVAVRLAFAAEGVPERYRPLVDQNRRGEALFAAIRDFSDGAGGDYDQVADALAYFRWLGLEDAARRAALELMLMTET